MSPWFYTVFIGPFAGGVIAFFAVTISPNAIPIWFLITEAVVLLFSCVWMYIAAELSLSPGQRTLGRWMRSTGHNHGGGDAKCSIDCPRHPYY